MFENKARWIWYRGDFEIYHSLLLHSKREDRGYHRPTCWSLPTPYPRVDFYKKFTAEKETTICFYSNGAGRAIVRGISYPFETEITVPAGTHEVLVELVNPQGLPALFVDSEYLKTDNTWLVNNGNGKNIYAGDIPHYCSKNDNPEKFIFKYKRVDFISKREVDGGVLYDFGKELCAEVCINGVDCDNKITVCYGESEDEALDIKNAIIHEKIEGCENYRLHSRAFRYLHIKMSKLQKTEIYADYEYLPLDDIGQFKCENELVNKIWDVCAYTFHLNSREFFLDGIKRDRWVWSGDSYQSFMADYYLYFDTEIIKRTIIALVGKPPYERHINTINDYTLYMIIALYDYYFASGDIEFVEFIFERIKALYDFTVSRLDENGFVCLRNGDWIFIDWSPMDKSGPLCAEQILLWKAHLTMKKLSELLEKDVAIYEERANTLYTRINNYFWNEEKGAYIDSYVSGKNNVTRHANIFAILYDFADKNKTDLIVQNVLNNDDVTQITTPYFNLFQLMARCKIGDIDYAQNQIESYWGGMIKLGATSIWEAFDPTKNGAEHYEMYGDKFGKSLCHAWGAGPIILLSKYCLGVTPAEVGYKSFEVHPNPGKYSQIKGTVPLNGGKVDVELTCGKLKVFSTADGGYVIHQNEKIPIPAGKPFVIDNYKF